jgi:hypothetical protein
MKAGQKLDADLFLIIEEIVLRGNDFFTNRRVFLTNSGLAK